MIRLKGLLKEQPEVKESEFVDDDDIIKFKDENGKPREMKAGAAKTMKQGSPAKKAWDDANEKGQKAAAGGGDDDKKDTTGVSFDRTAGKGDDDSKSDDKKSAPAEKTYDSSNITKNKDGNDVFYVGGAGNEEEIDVSYLNSSLDIGLSDEKLTQMFKDGEASLSMDPDSGRVDFYLEDDNGMISAEVEDGGYFSGEFGEYEGADEDSLEDSLDTFLNRNLYDDKKPTWDKAYDKALNMTADQFQALADEYGFEYNGETEEHMGKEYADVDGSGFGDYIDGEDDDDEYSADLNTSIRKALHPETKTTDESKKSSGNIKLSELLKLKK